MLDKAPENPEAVVICRPASTFFNPPPGAKPEDIEKAHCGHPVYLHASSRITISRKTCLVVCDTCAHEQGWDKGRLLAPAYQRELLRQDGLSDEQIDFSYKRLNIHEESE